MENIDPLAKRNLENMELTTEVYELKAQIEDFKKLHEDCHALHMAEKGNLVVTEARLLKYGGHTAECSSRESHWEGGKWLNVDCTCGWAEIEKELK